MNSPDIRKLQPAGPNRALVSDIICRAFECDPLLTWIARKDRHHARRIGLLVKTTIDLYLPVSEIYLESYGKGCALWVTPSPPALTVLQTVHVLKMFYSVAGLKRLPAMIRFFTEFERLAPAEPAVHLFYLAVLPEAQGQGIGSALLQPVLQNCDAERIPAYLENSNSANLPLYERHGFRLTRQWRIADNGPSIWCMYRDPQ